KNPRHPPRGASNRKCLLHRHARHFLAAGEAMHSALHDFISVSMVEGLSIHRCIHLKVRAVVPHCQPLEVDEKLASNSSTTHSWVDVYSSELVQCGNNGSKPNHS